MQDRGPAALHELVQLGTDSAVAPHHGTGGGGT